MKTLLILGATSDVGMACAEYFASKGFNIQLAARSKERMEPLASDIKIRHGREVSIHAFDASVFDSHEAFFNALPVKPEVTLCMFGYLGNQETAQKDFKESLKIITANYTGAVSILNVIANYYERQKSGTIIGVSSVAGERGRMSNYMYGSAKAAFSSYLSGLRNRLAHHNAHVLTVKPGFMDTKMTEGLPLPKPLTASPEEAAKAIYNGFRKKKNVVYVKGIWKLIMLIIRNIPEGIFKKLKM